MANRLKVPIRRWLAWLMLCCVAAAGNAPADNRSSTFRIGLRLTALCQVDSDQLVTEQWLGERHQMQHAASAHA